MQNTLPKPLRGIVPPMITPLASPDALDLAGLERLIEHILAGRVSGLFILGTTGEAPALSYRLRRELIDSSCSLVAGRVPVIVGVTDTSYSESMSLACAAAKGGASAVVVAPPYYFAASQHELCRYLLRMASDLPLPVFFYNAPAYTHHFLELETVRRLSEYDNVAGIKDSSLSMIYFHKLVRLFRDRPDFTLLVGPEELMIEAVLLGGHGGMCGGANICPRLYVDAYQAAVTGHLEEASRLQRRIMDVSATVYHVAGEDSAYLRGLKCAVRLTGICGDCMAEPFRAFDEADRAEVRRRMVSAGLLES